MALLHRPRRRGLDTLGMAVLTLGLVVQPLAGQVGHPPGHSPYRDITKGHAVTALGVYLGGDGGRFGIAPHHGAMFGVRYDIRSGNTLGMALGFARGDLDRLIVDPFVRVADRVSGPVKQTVSLAEFDLQFNLTGGKTWHRLAPFVGAGVGATFASGTPADSSGFKFGHKIYLVPSTGFRFFITDRLHLRGEARLAFWKLKYPTTFEQEPTLEPGNPPLTSNAVITDGRTSEWNATPWIQAGLSYSFSP
jgi:hypothetical protein